MYATHLWVFHTKDRVEVYHKPFNLELLHLNKPRQHHPVVRKQFHGTGLYPKALHTLSSLYMQRLDLGPFGERKAKHRELIQQGHSWWHLCPNTARSSEAILWQAAPSTHIWEDYTEHLRVFCSLSLALRIRNFSDGYIMQLRTTCSENRSHSILSFNFAYSCNLLQKCAHFILGFYMKDFKELFFSGK